MNIDLGAGDCRLPGFLRLDRFPLSGIGVVADLDRPLPFADSSFSLILAGHSLEHVRDLMATMREVYRVSQDRAQLCILAPYGQQSLHAANPYHFQHFNEHTPRFWSSMAESVVAREEYAADSRDRSPWGLSRSDHSNPGIECQCVRMQFFYASAYRSLSADRQREARRTYINVCEQVLYHLVVTKTPIGASELHSIAQTMAFYIPPGASVT